jgi:ADP-ribose pyrophosphatase YjhB (NUDIX family)
MRDAQILFLHRKKSPEPGTWALPGGKIDFGETPVAALIRELHEELGIAATIGALVGVTSFVDKPSGIHWISPIYLVSAWEGVPDIQEPHKHAALDWFAPSALPHPLMTPTREAMGFLS